MCPGQARRGLGGGDREGLLQGRRDRDSLEVGPTERPDLSREGVGGRTSPMEPPAGTKPPAVPTPSVRGPKNMELPGLKEVPGHLLPEMQSPSGGL